MCEVMKKLTDIDKKIFENFQSIFSKANPDSVIKFISAKREKNYLRVTLTRNGTEDWYHVVDGGRTWY